MAVRAVVFDLFDTLVDLLSENLPPEEHHGVPLPASVRNVHDALTTTHADVSFEAFTRALIDGARDFGRTHFAYEREVSTRERFEDLLRRLDLGDAALPDVLTDVHMGMLRRQVRVPDHHAELLARLGARLPLALCSNFSHSETAEGVLRDAGFYEHFRAIVVSDAIGLRKPRPEIFQAALDALEVDAGEVLHVGDSLRADVAGAAACGIHTVWITRRVRDREAALAKYAGPAPDHEIADLGELPALLDRLDP